MYTYLSELDRIMALEIAGNGQTYFHLNPRDAFPTTSELQLTAYNIAISERMIIYIWASKSPLRGEIGK